MAKRQDISADLARQLLSYDPETGILRWKPRTPDMFEDGITLDSLGRRPRTAEHQCNNWNALYAGKEAGTPVKGYVSISINLKGRKKKKHYLAHNLAWLIETGEWPENEIDHRDGDRSNNMWSNFRPATRAQQRQNVALSKNSTTGYIGVSWSKEKKKYKSNIMKNRKNIFLGYFDDPKLAHEAYKKAKSELHTFQPTLRK